MNSYRVCWSIDVMANSAEEAAAKALEIQRDTDSTATVFEVYGPGCPTEGLEIDTEDFV